MFSPKTVNSSEKTGRSQMVRTKAPKGHEAFNVQDVVLDEDARRSSGSGWRPAQQVVVDLGPGVRKN